MIRVYWKQKLFRAGWVVPSKNTTISYLFFKRKLWRIPRDLRNPSIRNRFFKLFSTTFLEWWSQTCASSGDKIFLLNFPSGAWEIPWELLIERLKITNKQANVCLARTAGKSEPVAPSLFDEPLRILMLKGAYNGLNLDEEVRLVDKAWESLELNVRKCIEKPIALEARQEDFGLCLQKYRPHIIWFSGHGRVKSGVELLFADGSWIGASELANLIQKSGQRPLYAVFWACDTARSEKKRRGVSCSPSLFAELRKIGVLSVLAMQSPIRDSSALIMAQHLFRYLAAGLPLEKAISRSRAHLMESPLDEYSLYPLDWASPVTWSSGIPVDKLQWNAKGQKMAQFQVLGRYVLGWGQARPQQLDAPIVESEKSHAYKWAQQARTWIQGDINEAEHRYYWVRILQAIQFQTPWFVIAAEMDSNDSWTSMQNWANDLFQRMLPGDFPEEVAQILEEITRNPVVGWSKLCSLDGIYLAIASPSQYGSDWFWRPILRLRRRMHVVVLSNQSLSKNILENWKIDKIGIAMDNIAIEIAISKAPRLARALAMLNIPLGAWYLSVQAKKEEGTATLLDWSEWKSVMIETAAGPIMTATARQYVLNKIDSDDIRREAHFDCVKILRNPKLTLTPAICEHYLDHLLGAGLERDALCTALDLCNFYYDINSPSSVLRVIERLGPLQISLPSALYLIVACANLQLGRVTHAKHWLDRSSPKELLDIAWKHALQAEVYKSEGTMLSKENALREIKEAIRVCQKAQKNSTYKLLIQRKILAYHQDLARIKQFLFYDLEGAAKEYENLVQEWNNLPNPEIELAVVMRNYAECLRSLASGPDDLRWKKAQNLLQQAEGLIQSYPTAPVLSEIFYEKAKTAEKENSLNESNIYLEKCKEAAIKSRHYMMLAIAENRLFWNREPFSIRRWGEIESDLKGFPHHGWAVRTLIDSRLLVAKILEEKGDFTRSFAQLEANLSDLKRNPSFDKGRDRSRIARTFAGLQLIGDKMKRDVSFWKDFLKQYLWATDWLREHSLRNYENVWKEVK